MLPEVKLNDNDLVVLAWTGTEVKGFADSLWHILNEYSAQLQPETLSRLTALQENLQIIVEEGVEPYVEDDE